ncbi:MAG: hypothetical protein E6R07_14905 [Nevskiaceae bacterium]|nr:MAG: hypothetical protein E6R07_14905 [Nevskiaceae bacterium]
MAAGVLARGARRLALAATLTALLGGCATLYSTTREWKLPGGLARYTLKAQMSFGFLTRQIAISINDRPLLTGESYWWSDTTTMSGAIEGLPLDATCNNAAKTCEVAIAGIHAASLKF